VKQKRGRQPCIGYIFSNRFNDSSCFHDLKHGAPSEACTTPQHRFPQMPLAITFTQKLVGTNFWFLDILNSDVLVVIVNRNKHLGSPQTSGKGSYAFPAFTSSKSCCASFGVRLP
jgi:hypothetical protein